MPLNIAYGGYPHAVGEAGLVIAKQTEFNVAQEPLHTREQWTINGMIVGSSLSDLNTKIAALEEAYSSHGGDLTLSGGSNSISSANTLGGTRVVSFAWNDNKPAAHTTWREYTAVVEALIPVSGSSDLLVSFSEVISRRGGGPMTGYLEPLQGRPIKQTWKQQTVYRVQQQGSAVGYRKPPRFPSPIWPAYLVEPFSDTVAGQPQRHNSGGPLIYTHYPINWTYQFESDVPLIGTPNKWGRT